MQDLGGDNAPQHPRDVAHNEVSQVLTCADPPLTRGIDRAVQ